MQEKLFQSHFSDISLEMVAVAVCRCNSRVIIPIKVLFNLDSFVRGGHKEVEFLSMKLMYFMTTSLHGLLVSLNFKILDKDR